MRQEPFGGFETVDEERTESAEAVMSVFDETVALYFRIRAASEDIHGHSRISGAMRGVLRDLRKSGPQTVPQLARRRPVTRQHIQAIVNDLQRAGLVELIDNPAHKRSRLISMTPAGEQALDEIVAREEAMLSRTEIPVSVAELEAARRVLGRLRETLESDQWRRLITELFYPEGEAPRNPWIDGSEYDPLPGRRDGHSR